MLKPKYHERFGVSNVEWFVGEMKKLEKKNQFFDNTDILLNMTDEDDKKFIKATECWLCNKQFTPLSLVFNGNGKVFGKVGDHFRSTGRYRVAAHNMLLPRRFSQKDLPMLILIIGLVKIWFRNCFPSSFSFNPGFHFERNKTFSKQLVKDAEVSFLSGKVQIFLRSYQSLPKYIYNLQFFRTIFNYI